MRSSLLTFLAISTVSPLCHASGSFKGPIEHVVLLMLENRAFDHMCGFFPRVNGLVGNETNPVDTEHPEKGTVRVGKTSPYVGPFDPDHSTPATTDKIFGEACLSKPGGGCNVPTMDGFIEYASKRHSLSEASSVMNMFTPDRIPVMAKLAEEFALFDRFFASHPGPTWPNRLFQLMGTSKGCTETSHWDPKTFLYEGKTVFDVVEEAGHDWKFYYADVPLELAMLEKLVQHPKKVHGWGRFKRDIAAGALPAFSWVNPRWFVNETTGEGASDQHPDHDVRMGEALLKEVYEDLRAAPTWNKTLFIITYDEHGGYYDHVPPPMNVPAPDDSKSFPDEDFQFTRLGVRIPTLLVSPWIKRGTVISEPRPAEKPHANSEFDLTSVIATVRNIFGGEHTRALTKREAWAATFDERLNEREARRDCPKTLPAAPKSLGAERARQEAALPLNDLQVDIVNAFATLRGDGVEAHGPLPQYQGEAGKWFENVVADVLDGKNVREEAGAAPNN